MIKVAICDDDKNIIKNIKKYVESHKNNYRIELFNSGEELLLEQKNYEIIFLDIEMQGKNGIETARNIRKYDKDVKIIYVTSYTDYMNLAFSVHAFGYINKPVSEKEIHQQLDEAIIYTKESDEVLLEFLTLEGVLRIKSSDIYYFEYIDRKIILKTNEKKYILKDKISVLGEKMKEFGFCMPHKSFSVNLLHVKTIKGYDIFMMDGNIIPLSQKKSSEFREAFNIFLENRILE